MVFDWQYALDILPDLLRGFWVTIQATFWGMTAALILGLAWAILRRSAIRIMATITAWVVEFIRSTPLLVQLYFLFFVLPEFGVTLSPFLTGVVGLGLHYSTYTSEVYRAGIEGVPEGQWEAAIALNMSRFHIWKAIILPQAIPPVIPALGNYLIAMFKDTPLLAAITVMELLQTAKLSGAETFRYLEPLTLVGLLFLVISLLSSRLIRKLEARFAQT
ncbi:ectoine/hydroxyectoine ABC transporter, permease protein EhuD [Nitrosococcus halophilus Nc 4]|uniref:Ectoine/hydroxyectoine ABC transporter, permease protein EhuD n=1 Tax=Nitrosococcus halophilus (strain Nc4) TaxID=472759 RepID=D5BX95_NITHN|nr:ectoine/hydroxyectoine ABC transporter permease subunit EhuD [Nitrosococcus halophilus]ADE15778.1 ectoine/hydroxyectoine ABC transporter, permease protein EhuD [Nitrosococcus halophilus Nc 4]